MRKQTLKVFNIIKVLTVVLALSVIGIMVNNNVKAQSNVKAFSSVNYKGGSEETGFFAVAPNSQFENRYDKTSYYGFKISDRLIARKIVGDQNYQDTIYCLNNNLNFPGTNTQYTSLGELSLLNSIGQYNITQEQKNRIYWFANNLMYVRVEDQENKKTLKQFIFEQTAKKVANNQNIDSTHLQTAMRRYNVNVTDSLMEYINQWVIWNIIQRDNTFANASVTIKPIVDALNEVNLEADKKKAVREVYEYLVSEVNKNGNTPIVNTDLNIGTDAITFGTPQLVATSASRNTYKVRANSRIPLHLASKITNMKLYASKAGTSEKVEIRPHHIQVKTITGSNIAFNELKEVAGVSNFDLEIEIDKKYDELSMELAGAYKVTNLEVFTPAAAQTQPVVKITSRILPIAANPRVPLPKPEPKVYDVALRKYIKSIEGVAPQVSREPQLNTTRLNYNGTLPARTEKTAEYNHRKDPLNAKVGDVVKYGIRVYNEYNTEAVINSIIDALPEHLELVDATESSINRKYGWIKMPGQGNKIKSDYLRGKTLAVPSVVSGQVQLDSKEVEVELRIKKEAQVGKVLTNIAYIQEQGFGADRDSTPGNTNIPSGTGLENYKGNTSNKSELTDSRYHYKGQEDDDDFEKVIIVPTPQETHDVALRKYIKSVEGVAPQVSREPNVDPTGLQYTDAGGNKTTAEYRHPKNPLDVETGDTVLYGIRVYNEYKTDAKVTTIVDALPDHMELKRNSTVNTKYGWTEFTRPEGKIISTNYLANTVLPGVKENQGRPNISMAEVEVELVVKDTATDGRILTNIAYIQGQEPRRDRDSEPGNTNIPTGTNRDSYKGNNANKSELDDAGYHYKGQEDDDDFEKIRVRKKPIADLVLRKFTTQINGNNVNPTREPVVDVTPLREGTDTTARYAHSKDPLLVEKGDIVKYTLRVYNEAEIPGIVNRITDYLPKGLGFLPEHKTNIANGWRVKAGQQNNVERNVSNYANSMLVDINLQEFEGVTDQSNVKIISNTDKLEVETEKLKTTMTEQQKEQVARTKVIPQEFANDVLLPFTNERTTPDYRDVEIVVVVLEDSQPTNQNEISLNLRNISEIDSAFPSKDRDSTPGNVTIPNYPNNPERGQEDDDDFEPLKTKPAVFDLALRKFIVEVNDNELANSRQPRVDVSSLQTGRETTARYTHSKDPLLVQKGDIVKYKLRVYNEAEIPGIVSKISDYLPKGLAFLPEHKTNIANGWVLKTGQQNNVEKKVKEYKDSFVAAPDLANFEGVNDVQEIKLVSNASNLVIESEKLKANMSDQEKVRMIKTKQIPDQYKDKVLKPFNKQTGEIDFKDIEIVAMVIEDSEQENQNGISLNLRNISEIHVAYPNNDRDSTPGNVTIPNYPNNPQRGQEDDDDFEPLKTRKVEFDLALRKFITEIDGKKPEQSREPKVDTTALKTGEEKTAKYSHPKTPLLVQKGDIVKYTLRVYNEGDMPGILGQIDDYLPSGLAFLPGHELNKQNGWVVDGRTADTTTLDKLEVTLKDDKQITKENDKIVAMVAKKDVQVGNKQNVLRVYSNKHKANLTDAEKFQLVREMKIPANLEGKVLKPFDKKTGKLDYKDIEIAAVVIVDVRQGENLRNISEITEDYPKNEVPDRDSTPGNGNPREDDEDFEKLDTKKNEFDLSLRKFITQVTSEDGKRKEKHEREPKVDISPLNNEETTAKYIHPKDPVLVAGKDVVEYTLRIYNEGDIAGYAKKVEDNIPVGLTFIANHPINKEYRWKMVDEAGKETNDLSKAKKLVTDYLSKEQGVKNLIQPYVKGSATLHFKDVKIAFKVKDGYKPSDGILKNIAEIGEDTDEKGNPVTDRDSTPGNRNPKEDDEDFEPLKPLEFDLALLKIVSKVFVTVDGKTKVINTKHRYTDRPEKVAKVELDKKKLNRTEVKYEYKIQITNQGNIPGYAKQISDYIPEGLEFVKADNPKWESKDGKTATTNQLAGKLLQPGQKAEVSIVLRWKKSEKNMGVKTNWAEISEDENPYGVPDKDSTPGNKKQGEDDIDPAPVALAIATGLAFTFFVITLTTLTVLATGLFILKKVGYGKK